MAVAIVMAGALLLFLGLAPIVSKRYFERAYKSLWRSGLLPEEFSRIYSRYIQQIWPLAMGTLLVILGLYILLG